MIFPRGQKPRNSHTELGIAKKSEGVRFEFSPDLGFVHEFVFDPRILEFGSRVSVGARLPVLVLGPCRPSTRNGASLVPAPVCFIPLFQRLNCQALSRELRFLMGKGPARPQHQTKESPMTKTEKRATESRHSNTNSSTTFDPRGWHRGPFDFQRLDAYAVAREALVLGDTLARRLPRGYGKLADQLRRALLSAHLGIAEAASRTGADRTSRFRCARGEASEAAAALDAIALLKLAPLSQVDALVTLLGRLCAMLTRLAGLGR